MHSDRKTEILDAFIRLVSRFGFDKTTMHDIAKEVGISVGVIYKDFKNKEELVHTYIQQTTQKFSFFADQIIESDLTPEQMLHDLILNLFKKIGQFSIEDRGFWQFIRADEGLKCLRKYGPLQEKDPMSLTKKIEVIMKRGVEEGCFEIEDIPKTAALFNSAFKGFFPDLILFGKKQDEVLQNYEDMFVFLIRAIRKR